MNDVRLARSRRILTAVLMGVILLLPHMGAVFACQMQDTVTNSCCCHDTADSICDQNGEGPIQDVSIAKCCDVINTKVSFLNASTEPKLLKVLLLKAPQPPPNCQHAEFLPDLAVNQNSYDWRKPHLSFSDSPTYLLTQRIRI